MKLRNKILAMAVVAVAGVNVYLANDIRVQRNELSLLNLENIAEGSEWDHEGSNDNFEIYWDDLGNGETLWNVFGPDYAQAGYCISCEQTCYVPVNGTDFRVGTGKKETF